MRKRRDILHRYERTEEGREMEEALSYDTSWWKYQWMVAVTTTMTNVILSMKILGEVSSGLRSRI
jgi:hypothetical protein